MFAKNDKFWYLNPILGKLGVTHDLLVDELSVGDDCIHASFVPSF